MLVCVVVRRKIYVCSFKMLNEFQLFQNCEKNEGEYVNGRDSCFVLYAKGVGDFV